MPETILTQTEARAQALQIAEGMPLEARSA